MAKAIITEKVESRENLKLLSKLTVLIYLDYEAGYLLSFP